MLELDNNQRKYFGLDPVLDSWDRVAFKGDSYRPDSTLYYENGTIKKHIISTEQEYKEIQYDEETENREWILPKTKRGKPKKLTASVLESRTPIGVYLSINTGGDLIIGNHTTQTTFYSRDWEYRKTAVDVKKVIKEFIENSPADHLHQIEEYLKAKRKNVKYKSGDFFAFRLNRKEYGFGRILFDVHKARKMNLLPENHGLYLLMGPPLLIKYYAFKSEQKLVDIEALKVQKSLPADYIMDNIVFYGEYEIIGNIPLEIHEFEFPISYGGNIDQAPHVFLQWGLIHKELPQKEFNKYTNAMNTNLPENHPSRFLHNPYGYYGIGFRSKFDPFDINETIKNNGEFNFSEGKHFNHEWDLRNPKNDHIRAEILKKFGLDPTRSYEENRKKIGAPNILEMIKEMN